MARTIVVCGYGTGISMAVAERFGREGFSVALVARSSERLTAGVKALESQGIRASAFAADLADLEGLKTLFKSIREKLGSITILQWNAAYAGAPDLLSADAAALRELFELPIVSLTRAVQEVLPDLRKDENSALLVTNGVLGLFDPHIDEMAVAWNRMGLAVANAAKHKLVGLLSAKLKQEGIYVGEVVVKALVKGTPSDNGSATLDPAVVGERFWSLYHSRSEPSVVVG